MYVPLYFTYDAVSQSDDLGRKIYRPKCEQGVCKVRSTLELQKAYKSPDIVTEIKITRLEWLGHIIRMEDSRIP